MVVEVIAFNGKPTSPGRFLGMAVFVVIAWQPG